MSKASRKYKETCKEFNRSDTETLSIFTKKEQSLHGYRKHRRKCGKIFKIDVPF